MELSGSKLLIHLYGAKMDDPRDSDPSAEEVPDKEMDQGKDWDTRCLYNCLTSTSESSKDDNEKD